MTLQEVAGFLKVSIRTVRRLIEDEKLRAIKVRGAVRVWYRDLMDYLNGEAA